MRVARPVQYSHARTAPAQASPNAASPTAMLLPSRPIRRLAYTRRLLPPYSEAAVSLPQTFSGGGYTLPLDLNQVQGLDLVTLTAAQRALLAQNGFAVAAPVPGQYREFYQIYEQSRYDEIPVFITTDSIYHVYHLIFDKMLRDLETGYFIADLKSLTTTMLAATTSPVPVPEGHCAGRPRPAQRRLFCRGRPAPGPLGPGPGRSGRHGQCRAGPDQRRQHRRHLAHLGPARPAARI